MDLYLRLVCILLALGILQTSGVENISSCAYRCSEPCGDWYTTTADGACSDRSAKTATFYTFDFMCDLEPARTIRDRMSCQNVIKDRFSTPLGDDLVTGKIDYTFDEEHGCRINWLNNNEMSAVDLGIIHAPVCFGQYNGLWMICSQLFAAAVAIVVGIAGGCCSSSSSDEFVVEASQNDSHLNWETYGPGAKMVAKNTLLNWKLLHFLTFYRFTQVLANVWFPAISLWKESQSIVIPVVCVLFLLPAFITVGGRVFWQPRHFVSPPLISLLGMDPHGSQEYAPCRYLFSLIRPMLFVALGWVFQVIVVKILRAAGMPDIHIQPWVVNAWTWPYVSSSPYWGVLCIWMTELVTMIGVFLYMILTIKPVVKALCDLPRHNDYISMTEDPVFEKTFNQLALRICREATADELDDRDRVEDIVQTTSHGEVTLAFWKRRDVVFSISMALVDFVSYLYRIRTLLRDSRTLLAMMMTYACVQPLTSLAYQGHLKNAWEACRLTARTGIPTTTFLALCQWDEGTAGIPALFITVYFLPLSFTADSTVYSVLMRAFFMITGTRALARYLIDVVDTGMYVIPEQDVSHPIEREFVVWGKNLAKESRDNLKKVEQNTRAIIKPLSDLLLDEFRPSKSSRALEPNVESRQTYAPLPKDDDLFAGTPRTSPQLPNGHLQTILCTSPLHSTRHINNLPELVMTKVVDKESTWESQTSRNSATPLLPVDTSRMHNSRAPSLSNISNISNPRSRTQSPPTGGRQTPPGGALSPPTIVHRFVPSAATVTRQRSASPTMMGPRPSVSPPWGFGAVSATPPLSSPHTSYGGVLSSHGGSSTFPVTPQGVSVRTAEGGPLVTPGGSSVNTHATQGTSIKFESHPVPDSSRQNVPLQVVHRQHEMQSFSPPAVVVVSPKRRTASPFR